MIQDIKQFDNFINILPDLKDDEVYFLSLSARNKYLSIEEREYYSLGRTEMFGRTLVKSKDDFYFTMKKLKSNLLYKLTKNGYKIPEKSLVTYININPSSMIKAYDRFINERNKELFEIYQAMKNNKEPNYTGFRIMERKLMNCIQKSHSRRCYIDIDMDIDNFELLQNFKIKLNKYNIVYYIIETKSGYHVLIKKNSLIKDFKLHEEIIQLNKIAQENKGEVTFNKNQMIPVPGTLQSNKLVIMY